MKVIQKMRLARGLTQAKLAEALDVDTSTVTKWETGKAKPRADKLPLLAKILGCSIDELFAE